jgi:hypothetical protein
MLALGAMRAQGQLTRDEAYELAARLLHDFEQTFGTVLCCELVGLDPNTPEWREAYHAKQAHAAICWPCVEFAVHRCWELMRSGSSADGSIT